MRNLWTTISVKNMDESVKFYTEILGLSLSKRYSPMAGMEIAFLGAGETKFELIFNKAREAVEYSGMVSTGFEVETVETMVNKLSELGYVVSEIMKPGPSIKFFFVTDPNGYKIQLVEFVN